MKMKNENVGAERQVSEVVRQRVPGHWTGDGERPMAERRCRGMTSYVYTVVLVLQVWRRVVKHGLVTLVVIVILKDRHSNFSSTIYSFSILCLEHHYCGDQQWRSLTQKYKFAKCLGLFPEVLNCMYV